MTRWRILPRRTEETRRTLPPQPVYLDGNGVPLNSGFYPGPAPLSVVGILGYPELVYPTLGDEEKIMKTMSCKQLGGACDTEFHAETFEEVAEQSQQHGVEMYQRQDPAHLEAMQQMQELMKNPDEMNRWLESKRKEFDSLSER